jgi:2-keto-4-pentenoate hydratase/2-oxohepta-3-ene-1,7-dioic acid hydratase in catechol pathway
MKYVSYRRGSEVRAGWLQNGFVVDLERSQQWAQEQGRCLEQRPLPASMLRFLEMGPEGHECVLEVAGALVDELLETVPFAYPLAEVELMAPVPQPRSFRDFYAFEEHVRNARARRGLGVVPEWYQFPVFYFSNHNAFHGPESEVERPRYTQKLDYELEIAAVIGKEGRNISREQALDHVLGFAVLNDWSARDVQMEEVKVGLGPAKGKDFATSMGPYILTLDELEDLRDGDRWHLSMEARVNGETLSQGNFHSIYFSIAELIERASDGVTLYPGDVIGSGTVGTGCLLELGEEVHRWLLPGDVVELEIERLGVLRNKVVAPREE